MALRIDRSRQVRVTIVSGPPGSSSDSPAPVWPQVVVPWRKFSSRASSRGGGSPSLANAKTAPNKVTFSREVEHTDDDTTLFSESSEVGIDILSYSYHIFVYSLFSVLSLVSRSSFHMVRSI